MNGWRASELSNPPTDVGEVERQELRNIRQRQMEKGLVSSKVFVIALVISHPALGVMMQQAIHTVLGHFLRDT